MSKIIFRYIANPGRVMSWLRLLTPFMACLCLVTATAGLYFALSASPKDYLQGDLVRIMYVHVPSSWWALGVYTIMAIASAFGFVLKNPFMGYITRALAPLGASFALVSLVTGAIWGKPTWGTWWVWDARLTSMLLLFLLYIGYILLVRTGVASKSYQAGGVLTMVGWINVPIIKWSVDWWYSLHQPSSIKLFAKSSVHPEMLTPLLLMSIAFASYGFIIFHWRLKQLLPKPRAEKVAVRQARAA